MADRAALATAFVQDAGWEAALRRPLAGDASERSYERLTRNGQTVLLMNAPPGRGDDPADFIRIAQYLTGIGLSAPQILARDLTHGFLLIEDFGDALYARLLADDPEREPALYAAATDVLAHLARAPLPPGLSSLTAAEWAQAASLALTDYAEPLTGPIDPTPLTRSLTTALLHHADAARVFIHRDFHAENLIALPERPGLRQTGLLDFQAGQGGQPGYDLVSLLQDARRDVSPQTEAAMQARYAASLGLDRRAFAASYATLGAQRALRILGIFARLARVAGKTRYLPMIPRVWDHLQRNLAHPALSDLRAACAALPAPGADALQKLGAA